MANSVLKYKLDGGGFIQECTQERLSLALMQSLPNKPIFHLYPRPEEEMAKYPPLYVKHCI